MSNLNEVWTLIKIQFYNSIIIKWNHSIMCPVNNWRSMKIYLQKCNDFWHCVFTRKFYFSPCNKVHEFSPKSMNIIFNKLNFTVTVYVFIKLKVMFSPLRLVIRFTDFLRTPPSPGTPTPRRSVSRQETSDLLHPCCQVNKPCCQVNKTCCQANKNLFF